MLMLVVPFVGMRLAVWVLVLKEDLMMSWPRHGGDAVVINRLRPSRRVDFTLVTSFAR